MRQKICADGFTDKELLKSLFSLDLLYKPGTDCQYSNAGYILLAMIIEKVSKMSYDKYVQKNIFDVCGWTTHPTLPFADNMEIYAHTGKTMSYSTDSVYCKTQHHGNIYIFQCCIAVTEKTSEYMYICDQSIINALAVKSW